MKTIALTFCLFTWLAPKAWAVREYYSLSNSVAALGAGGAIYSLSDNEYALFYNPAGLSLYRGKPQLMVSGSAALGDNALANLSLVLKTFSNSKDLATVANNINRLAGRPIYGNVSAFPYFITHGFGVGFLVNDTKLDFTLLGKDYASYAEVTVLSDFGVFITRAGSPFENFHCGATLKDVLRIGGRRQYSLLDFVRRAPLDYGLRDLGGAGVGVDLDLGATYTLPGFLASQQSGVSLVLSNVLGSKLDIYRAPGPGAPPGLPRMLSLGFFSAWEGVSFIDHFIFLLDLAEFGIGDQPDDNLGGRDGEFFKHVNVGLEMPIKGILFLRTGFHQGYLTAGFGVNYYAVKIDFATYEEELFGAPGRFGSRRFALRLALGFGAPDGRPALMTTAPIPEAPQSTPEPEPESLSVPESD